MKPRLTYWLITVSIALVWLVNGLICKLLGFVPRHQQIVAQILGIAHAPLLTKIIGCAEIIMALWILCGKYRRQTAAFQILIILTMNALEFILAPHLLLWGHFNIVFAVLFCVLIYYHGFRLKPNTKYAAIL